MNSEKKQQIIQYRLDRAKESLNAARIMFDHELLMSAMNRIYYSMFYAVQALLILNDQSFSKHGQVKGYFNKEFIKTGRFPKEFGKIFNIVFEYRQKYDYIDLSNPEKILISDYLIEAKRFPIVSVLNIKRYRA